MAQSPPRSPPRFTVLRRLAFYLALALLLLSLIGGFGSFPGDAAQVAAFRHAVDRWQHNPDFRAVAIEYSILSNRAMRTRVALLRPGRILMFLRSVPYLPPELAVNPTSALHYENFTRGPLSAYLHLCSEQGLEDFAPVIDALAKKENPTDDDIRQFLRSFNLPWPTATDAGAVQSVRAMLHDIGPQPLTIRSRIAAPLQPHVRALAHRLAIPDDPKSMTPAQQLLILNALDAEVKAADPALWRTKQASDLLSGIWAQGYGQIYARAIDGVNTAQLLLRLLSLLLLAALTLPPILRRQRNRHREPPVGHR